MPKRGPEFELDPRKLGQELEPNSPQVERLCSAVNMGWYGRGVTMFFGWSKDGRPMMVKNENQLSSKARESYKLSRAAEFPLDRESSSLPIIPIEFVSVGRPIDRKDPGEEDILVYGIKNEATDISFLRIEEIDAMEAILQGHVEWEDINTQTVTIHDTIPALTMHMTFVPAVNDQGEKITYAMMFSPVMQNESNERSYQQFLVQTIKSLITLDRQQKPNEKRGYEQAASALIDKDLEGGDAFVVMDFLKNNGIVNMDDEELNNLKKESTGKGLGFQLLLMAKQFGIVEMEDNKADARSEVEQFTIEELMKVVNLAYRLARRSIGK